MKIKKSTEIKAPELGMNYSDDVSAKRNIFNQVPSLISESSGATSSATVDENSWPEVLNQVFSDRMLIQPSKTLELLKELDDNYSKKPAAFFARRKKVMFLIEASKLLPGKCYYKRPVITTLKLIEEYKALKNLNIIEYLEYFRNEQRKICEQLLAKYLKDEVARLEDNEVMSIENLRNSIVEANDGLEFENPWMDIPREVVDEGAHKFLLQQVPEHETDELAKNMMFGYAVDRLIVQLCGWTKKGPDSMLEIIDLLEDDEERRNPVSVDKFTLRWITNVRICRQLAG